MSEAPPFRLGHVIVLLVLVAAAAGARGWYVGVCAGNGSEAPALSVQDKANAQAVAGPPAAADKAAHAAPLYPWLLSRLHAISSDEPSMNLAIRWMQCLLGTLTAVLYYVFTYRAFGSHMVGTLAGAFCALHPFWIINTAEMNDGVLVTFLLAACLYLAATGSLSGGALRSWFYGLALAGLALIRAALWPFAFIAMLWFLSRCRTLQRGWLYALLAILGCGTALAPWMVRNYREYHEVLPIVDATYLHLWIGNNPNASGGPGPATGQEILKQANPPLAHAVLNEIRDNPAGTLERRLWAGLDFFFGEDWFKAHQLWRAPPAGSSGNKLPAWCQKSYPALLAGSLLAMLVLAVLGWRWSYGWRHQARPASLALLWIPLPYLVSHAEALAGPRLPLDGVFLSYAAFAVACAFPRLARALLRGSED